MGAAKDAANLIINDAKKEAESRKKRLLVEAREETTV